MKWHREDEVSRRIATIPGVGPIGSSMLSMKAPPPETFRSGRDFAAWLGLTPKDHSTGGRQRHGGITKAGDSVLRSTLIVGATALLRHIRKGRHKPTLWLASLLERKPPKFSRGGLGEQVRPHRLALDDIGRSVQPAGSRHAYLI